jgi:hypothetical protein
VDTEEEFLFFLYKDLGCRLDKFSFLPFPQRCPLTLFTHLCLSWQWRTKHPTTSNCIELCCLDTSSRSWHVFSFMLSGMTQPDRTCVSIIFGTIPMRFDDRMGLGPVNEWKLHLDMWSISKSYHPKDTVDQQERARHLRPYLPRESIHHRFGHLTLWRSNIIAMLCVHHYIVSPSTMFGVLWWVSVSKDLSTREDDECGCGGGGGV